MHRQDLGPIVVTFAVHDGSAADLKQLGATLHEGPPNADRLQRVIVLLPKQLHELLGWPLETAPQVILMGMDEKPLLREIIITHAQY